VSRLDLELEPKAAAGRRIEVIRGGGGRRRWSDEEKARAVDASLVPGAVVSEVARLNGVTPQQLFTWRRQARCGSETSIDAPPFVPAIVDGDGESAPQTAASEPPILRPHAIELDVDGASVWIWRDAEPSMVTAIISALKGRK
jgi:transposase